MNFPPRFLDELRARLPVSERAGRAVRLKRRGREHIGLCPFHNEKTPSFTVNDDKGFFHCFGCGAHGDVIGFAMRHEALSFPEAVARLAAEAGLRVPEATPEAREREARSDGVRGALEFAAGWFARALARPGDPAGARYLAARGLTAETVERFRLGYAPASGRALAAALAAEGVAADLAREAGLIRDPGDGRPPFDFFRGRVMFPIGDGGGRTIGFGARALGDAPPKYLNSPESAVFRKGSALYNLAGARRAARDAGAVVAVEGYIDAIALAQAGIAHAVAPLGTSLTAEQLTALWRLAAEPVLCLDGDRAGRAAALRAAERALPLLAPGRSLSFVFLPEGEDPDSLIARAGVADMRARLAAAAPLIDLLWRGLTAGKSAATPERRAGLRQAIDRRVAEIADPRVRAQYAQAFRDRFDKAFPSARWSRRGGAARDRRPGAARGLETPARAPDDGARRERLMLATALNHPALLPDLAEELAGLEFRDAGSRRLQALLVDFAAVADEAPEGSTGESPAARLRASLARADALGYAERLLAPDGWDGGRLAESFARAGAGDEEALAGFRHLAARHRRGALEAELRAAEADLGERMDEEALALLVRLRHQLDAADRADAEPGGAAAAPGG